MVHKVYDSNGALVTVLKPGEERFPAVGEISFFLGIPQVYTFRGGFCQYLKLKHYQ